MGRCTVARWAFAAGLLYFCGCSVPRTFSPTSWMHGSDSSSASSTASTADKDKTNPLKGEGSDKTASKDDSSSAKDDSPKSSDPDGSSKSSAAVADRNSPDDGSGDKKTSGNGYKAAALDPQLRKLMEDELKSEPPEERRRLFNQWAKFDPAFIRELVENHRMARQIADDRQHPIKLTSAGQSQETDFDSLTPEAGRATTGSPRGTEPIAPSPSRGQSPGGMSPWSDSGDGPPPVFTRPPSNGKSVAVPPDAFATLPDSGSFNGPLTVGPKTPARASAAGNPANGAGGAAASGSGRGAATPPNPTSAADAFAGLAPGDDLTNGALAPPARPNGTSPVPPATQAAAAGPDPNAQPGPAGAPAPRSASDWPDIDSHTSPTKSPAGAARSKDAAANAASRPDSVQPVQLGLPTDIPAGAASPTELAAATGPASALTAATSPTAPPAGPKTTQPTGALAGLGNRLLGVINPNQNAAAAARNALQSANWHDELQKIVSAAAGEAGQTSVGTTDSEKLKYIEKQVQLRMLYILAGKPAKSLEPISGLEAADQEFWQKVFWGVANYFDTTAITDPNDRATQTITQLRAAVQRLQEKSKLELRNVAFCHKITNYGNYERFKRDEFTAGQPVLLYAEVENFKSEATADGPYRTLLKSTVEIFDSRGQLVDRPMTFPPTEDLCTSPRRDYYNSYEFPIPQRIGAGPHTLKLTVEDQISQKVATYTVNFTVK